MTGSDLSSAGLDARRRRILFRAWRRGVREMDLVMGQFADRHLAGLNAAELDAFEALLDAPDPAVLAWITKEAAPPPEYDTPLLGRLRQAPGEALQRQAKAP